MIDDRGGVDVVDAQEPAFELPEQPSAVAPATPQEGAQVAAALDPVGAGLEDRGEDLLLPRPEGGVLFFERLVLLLETDPLEPEIEGALGHPEDHPILGLDVSAFQHLEEAALRRIVARVDELHVALHVGGQIPRSSSSTRTRRDR